MQKQRKKPLMEFYEKMNPIDREIMILEAVQGSIALEGMQKAAQECREFLGFEISGLNKSAKPGC